MNIDNGYLATCTDKEAETFRSWLHDLLLERDVKIRFEKKDGTIRDMTCTLKESVVPETKGTGKEKSANTMSVFDVENNGWRSFTVRSVKRIRFDL